MSWLLVSAWVAVAARVAFATRPIGSVPSLDRPAPDDAPDGHDSIGPDGAGPGSAPGPSRCRWVVGGVLVAIVARWSWVAAAAVVVTGAGARWTATRRRDRRRGAQVERQLVLLVQVLDLAVGAGATLRLALAATGSRLGGRVGRAVVRASRRLEHGMGLHDALEQLAVEVDERDRGVFARVAAAEAVGAPVGAVLARAGRDLAEAERQRATLRARRLPVLLLVPLVACILPAFVVLAIVPMVASGAGSLFPP